MARRGMLAGVCVAALALAGMPAAGAAEDLPTYCYQEGPGTCLFQCFAAHFVVLIVEENDPGSVYATMTCGSAVAVCMGGSSPGQVDCMMNGIAAWDAAGVCSLTYGDRAICGDLPWDPMAPAENAEGLIKDQLPARP